MTKIVITESQLNKLVESKVIDTTVSPKMVKKWQKFNDELNEFYAYSETDCIYEDAFTERYVKNFNLDLNGTLTYIEDGKMTTEHMYDDEYALDWLRDFKKWLNKAKKYYAMSAETIDSIHDGNSEDLNESTTIYENCELVEDEWGEYDEYSLLQEWFNDKQHGIKTKQWDLIPKEPYWNALRNYMQYGEAFRTPEYLIDDWLRKIIHNTNCISIITDFAGHSSSFPYDTAKDFFFYDNEENAPSNMDYDEWSSLLDKEGFYDWAQLPDGSDAWSDFGLKPLVYILRELTDNSTKGEKLIIINRCLDVTHQRGDLASAFIEGGSKTCSEISSF